MGTELQILLNYPLLMPKDLDFRELEGFINVQGRDYKVHIGTCDGKIRLLHSDFEPPLLNGEYSDVMQYLDALHDALSKNNATTRIVNNTGHYRRVLIEYIEFREFYINIKHCLLSSDLTSISITTSDECGRTHHLKIGITSEPETNFTITEHDLPPNEALSTPNQSLKAVYQRFLRNLDELQPFFHVMECLDTLWVIDPETPTTKDNYRRIALVDNVSLVITVNPSMCNVAPQMQLLGPERFVDKLCVLIAQNLPAWDATGNIVDELLKLLEMKTFPARQTSNNEEALLYDTGDCCICFSSRCDGKLPEIVCKNTSCEQWFHTKCLYQWLVSVGATTKRSFNELHGECPFCQKQISCPAV